MPTSADANFVQRIAENGLLETPRLHLRRFTFDDVPVLFQLGTIPEVIRYVGAKPLVSLEQSREYLIKGPLRDYEVHGFGRLACVWKETGAVIGFSGIKHLEELNEDELGYRFLPEFWGKGLATEAGRAMIDHAREVYKLKRLVSVIHPDNHASKHVVMKLGFSYEKMVTESSDLEVAKELYSGVI